ncbi:MAG: MCP four helix bundle domain-containing protein [Proteobacteria bacterium]|nr:MCP four helix bundle domain-containing protein [Burkholderiales bacterium]
MTLRTQVAGGFTALLIVALIACGALYRSIDQVENDVKAITGNHFPKVLAANEIIQSVARNYIATANLVGLADGKADQAFKAEMKATSASITERFKTLESTVADDSGKALLAQALTVRKAYTDSRAVALEMAAKGNVEGARAQLLNDTHGRRIQYQAALAELIAHQNEQVARAATDAARAHASAAIVALCSALVLALAMTALCLLLLATLRRQLGADPREACAFAAEIAAGRLNLPLPPVRGPTHSVMGSLIAMRESLVGLLGEVDTSAKAVRDSAELALTTSTHLAALVSKQSDETASIAVSVEQLTVSVAQITGNAKVAQCASVDARGAAEQGAESIRLGVARIGRIGDSVRDAETAMSELGTKARDISTVIQVIRDIAEQTNLLALNAAIEAARAGEAGRGFAVVADEVRALAERTSRSTAEITAVVVTIQNVAQDTQTKMATVVTQVRDEEEHSAEVSGAIEGISSASARVSASVTEMSGSLDEQSAASTTIARKVEEIAQMNERSNAAASELEQLAKVLTDLSSRLDRSSGAFAVR